MLVDEDSDLVVFYFSQETIHFVIECRVLDDVAAPGYLANDAKTLVGLP